MGALAILQTFAALAGTAVASAVPLYDVQVGPGAEFLEVEARLPAGSSAPLALADGGERFVRRAEVETPRAGKQYRGPERASPHRHSCLARAISDAQSALDGSLAGGCRGVRSSVRWRSRGRPSTSPCRPGGRPRDSAHEFDASSGSERLARALSSPSRARQKSTGNYRLYLPRGPA